MLSLAEVTFVALYNYVLESKQTIVNEYTCMNYSQLKAKGKSILLILLTDMIA
jgi:hypothetical protein